MELEQLFSQPVADAFRQLVSAEVQRCLQQIAPNAGPIQTNIQPRPSSQSGRAAFSWMPKNTPPDATFICKWGKNNSDNETYCNVHEGLARLEGKTFSIRMGTTIRWAVGRRRARVTIWVDGILVVEFIGTTEEILDPVNSATDKKYPVASQIKVNRSTVTTPDAVPPEYAALEIPVGRYRDLISEPMASYGLAVICDQADVETMILHGLLRYRQNAM